MSRVAKKEVGRNSTTVWLLIRPWMFPRTPGGLSERGFSRVAHQSLHTYSVRFSLNQPAQHSKLLCPLCKPPVPLESAKTDENGRAVHEECYILKVRLKLASEC
jgi:hypothetical protein